MHKCKFLEAGQLPQEHLSFLQNLLNFFITKYLKQVSNILKKCSINFYHVVAFNSSSPYETQDKEIYHMMMS